MVVLLIIWQTELTDRRAMSSCLRTHRHPKARAKADKRRIGKKVFRNHATRCHSASAIHGIYSNFQSIKAESSSLLLYSSVKQKRNDIKSLQGGKAHSLALISCLIQDIYFASHQKNGIIEICFDLMPYVQHTYLIFTPASNNPVSSLCLSYNLHMNGCLFLFFCFGFREMKNTQDTSYLSKLQQQSAF